VFLYTLREGAATASFGLNVASLAGVPPTVIGRAAEIAERLHDGGGFAALAADQGGRASGALATAAGAELSAHVTFEKVGTELTALVARLLELLRSGTVNSEAVRDLQRLALIAGR
jgi:DNA mismatch repair ATPase MutS